MKVRTLSAALILSIVLSCTVLSCSSTLESTRKPTQEVPPGALEAAHELAQHQVMDQDIKSREAAVKDLGLKEAFGKLTNENFMLVFPKKSNTVEDAGKPRFVEGASGIEKQPWKPYEDEIMTPEGPASMKFDDFMNPIVYRFISIRNDECVKAIKFDLGQGGCRKFGKFLREDPAENRERGCGNDPKEPADPRDCFPAYMNEDMFKDNKTLDCKAIQFKALHPSNDRALNLRKFGDVYSFVLFMDELYRFYGQDKYFISNDVKCAGLKPDGLTARRPPFSGLEGWPIDVPVVDRDAMNFSDQLVETDDKGNDIVTGRRVMSQGSSKLVIKFDELQTREKDIPLAGEVIPRSGFVRKKLQSWAKSGKWRDFNIDCDAYTFETRDTDQQLKTRVIWCKGHPWPTVIENQGYFALFSEDDPETGKGN